MTASMRGLRILFVGEIHSTHAQSWMSLLETEEFSVRCFQTTPLSLPYSGEFRFPTMVPLGHGEDTRRKFVRQPNRLLRAALHLAGKARPAIRRGYALGALARFVRGWRPDIIHAFGLTPGAEFVHDALSRHDFRDAMGQWVIQLRGGSDLALAHLDPLRGPALAETARGADAIISDNPYNFEYLARLGCVVNPERRLIAPGTGGIDVDALEPASRVPPSARRLVLWPKAYESPWSKSLPVLEALRLAFEHAKPWPVQLLLADEETQAWLRLWPKPLQQSVSVGGRIERDRVLELMTQARLVLAPSLVDGTPNSMWEAMAAGAVPLVSPLPTLTGLVNDGEQVLFARNLHPDELALQIVRVMTDDALAERIAVENRSFVRKHADRAIIGPRVREFYLGLARRTP